MTNDKMNSKKMLNFDDQQTVYKENLNNEFGLKKNGKYGCMMDKIIES